MRIPYDEAGTGDLVAQLVDMAPATVLLEATGGLELPLVAALAAAALPVVVVNPRQVRDDRCEISPKPPANWSRLTPWTPRSWPTSPRQCVHRCARCGMPTPRNSTR